MSQWKKALFFGRFGSGRRDVPDEEGTESGTTTSGITGIPKRRRDVPDEEGTERTCAAKSRWPDSRSRDVPDEEGTESQASTHLWSLGERLSD